MAVHDGGLMGNLNSGQISLAICAADRMAPSM